MLFGAMNFPVLPVGEEIDRFAGLGFDYLELTMDPPMAHFSILAEQRDELILRLRENNLGLVCHLPTFLSTADLTESIRKASAVEMLHSLEVAVSLGAEKVVLHPSMVFGMGAYVVATVKKFAFEFLAVMVEAADKLDITLCLENMMPRNILGAEPDQLEEIFTAFPSLKFTLDTGHANLGDPQGYRLKELVKRFGSRLRHVHLSDNQGFRDEHLAVGGGTVDFQGLLSDLHEIGYDGTVTFEVFDDNRQMLVDSRERIERMTAKL